MRTAAGQSVHLGPSPHPLAHPAARPTRPLPNATHSSAQLVGMAGVDALLRCLRLQQYSGALDEQVSHAETRYKKLARYRLLCMQ